MTGIGIVRTTAVLSLAFVASCSSADDIVRLAKAGSREAAAAERLVIRQTPAAGGAITRIAPEVGTLTRGALGDTVQVGTRAPLPSSALEDLWRSVASPSVRPSVAGQLTKTEQRTQYLLDEILRANSRGDRAARDLLLQRYNAQVDNATLRRPSKVIVGQSGVDRAGHPDTPAQWHQAGVAAAEAERALEGRLRRAEDSLRRIGRDDMIEPVRRRLTREVEPYARRSVRHTDVAEQNARKRWSRLLDEWCVEDPGVFRTFAGALRNRELGPRETAAFASRVRDLAQRRGRQTTCLDTPGAAAVFALPIAGVAGLGTFNSFDHDASDQAQSNTSSRAGDDVASSATAPSPPLQEGTGWARSFQQYARRRAQCARSARSSNDEWRCVLDLALVDALRASQPRSDQTTVAQPLLLHDIGAPAAIPDVVLPAPSIAAVQRFDAAGALDRTRFSEEMRLRRTQAEADGVVSRIGDALTDPINLVFRPSGFTELAGIALVAATDTPAGTPKTTGQKALWTLGWILMLAPIAWALLRRL